MSYARLIRPWLWLLPPELAHELAVGASRAAGAVRSGRRWLRAMSRVPDDPALHVRAMGLDFRNPIGLAAGFDKNGVVLDAIDALGFGFVEVGTVTAHPQPGQPRPRLFRLTADRALVNRMGFNNDGAVVVARRLAARPADRRLVVGVNVGKSRLVPDEDAIDDQVTAVRWLAPHADYLVVNVSSPNTPGLRDWQAPDRLRPLLAAVREAADEARPRHRVPLLVKVAPDLSDDALDAIADLAMESGLDGIVATNTTVAREGLRTDPRRLARIGPGGLSGVPLAARSIRVLERLAQRTAGRLVLISVGGIDGPEEALRRLRAGATLVQLYTGLVYEGPSLPGRIARAILADRANRMA
ncbi:MAG: quinone-dependent dihydroorotate dehydrogenase [Myxococcota bacterium]|nr:quinone-dependent dihydroorotate dehydrogenase [Myxococcota bacterium]MDW8363385.1 quinone-dependent dihydroorotate dehydrogenase [Myxococcales bacterium]